jgi:hypothetical protein
LTRFRKWLIGFILNLNSYKPPKTEFASVADGWLLAYAHANRMTVVTHEEFAPQAKRKVPMPNVCLEFGINYVNTFQMLANLNVKFIRSTKNPN